MRLEDLDESLVMELSPMTPFASPTTGNAANPTGQAAPQTAQPNMGGTTQPDPKQKALIAADIQKQIEALKVQKQTLQKQMQDIDKNISELNRRKAI